MNKRRLFIRILVSPFVLGLLLTTYNFHAFKRFLFFMKYGGEFINYEKDEIKRIQDIYLELKKQTNG